MRRISEVTFLLVAIAFGGVRGECDKCNADNPVACHSETVYSLCLIDQPTMKFVTCPPDYICTSDEFVCYPRDSAVPSCGRTNPVEDGSSKCGICASRDKLYACLNETTIAFCFGDDMPHYESLSYCPADTVCDLNRESGFCTPAAQTAPSCIPSQWTTPIATTTTVGGPPIPTTTTPVLSTTTDISSTTSLSTTTTPVPTTTTDIPTTTTLPITTTSIPTTTTDIPTTTTLPITTTQIPTTTTNIPTTTSLPTTTTPIPTTTTNIPTTTSLPTTTTQIPTTTTDIPTTTISPITTTQIPTTTTNIPTTMSLPTTTTPMPTTTTNIPTTTSLPTTTTQIPTTKTNIPTTTSLPTTTTNIPTTTSLPTTTTPIPTTTTNIPTTTSLPTTTTPIPTTTTNIPTTTSLPTTTTPIPTTTTSLPTTTTTTTPIPTTTSSLPTTTTTTTPIPTTTTNIPTTTPLLITTTFIPITTTEHVLTLEEICEKHGKDETIPLPDDLTCKKSIRCKKNGNVWKADLSTCPTNQWFDPGLKFCTATYKCPTQSPPATTSTPVPITTTERTLTLEEICENHGEQGNIARPDDPTCKKYIVCSKPGSRWIAQAYTCRNLYDPTINKCSSTYKCPS
ncbi:hepatitis A virus cellular receptor 1 isoform X2 [Zeugodacus cucurbitae]|uniref:hepatitis A virus cellular receptor 1 isoform X2 n=1 Tax=Zeugodacus cucurbitae TaxID=28588 RepID=UPI0010A74C87|nr:hepatitis A virus cellular receptor 1 isoform X2 [Zeugodacus cucurbitae]